MTFDVHNFRQHFAFFDDEPSGQIAYLDNAATTQIAKPVLSAINDYYSNQHANIHRSSHKLARQTTDMVEQTRALTAQFINAASHEIVFTSGTTAGINQVAYGLSHYINAKDTIAFTNLEHHANILPWQRIAAQQNAQLFCADLLGNLNNLENFVESLPETTKFLAITAASNVTGHRIDIARLSTLTKRRGILLLVDAAQHFGHQPIDVEEWNCDFLVASMHKAYGPTGTGVLYVKSSAVKPLEPLILGGGIVEKVSELSAKFVEAPHRFEAGTPNLAGIAGVHAMLNFIRQNPEATGHKQQLQRLLHSELLQISDLNIVSDKHNHCGIVSFFPTSRSGLSASDCADWLDKSRIASRSGHHCAQLLHHHLGIPHSVRLSIAPYNTAEEINLAVNAVKDFFISNTTKSIAKENEKPLWKRVELASNWQQQYRLIIQAGKQENSASIRCEDNAVSGCEANVWLLHRCEDKQHFFEIDSDSAVIKGLGVLLLEQVNGKDKNAIDIKSLKQWLTTAQLDKHLSSSRNNGIAIILKHIERAL